ncbi:ATP-binding protein [Salipiger bermudensis]|uniref:ATP-binding protein n=1 Tax=Salipiger bermudensis TaxID=344736 RepID=UPI001CD4F053|nr:ATP-binding protein [Salipiger bermudensis]MCA0961493.1 ATP-binding protein [Salipiger bermudensis]
MKPAKLTTVTLEQSADVARLRDVAMTLTTVLNFGAFERTRTVTAVVELGRNAIEHGQKGRATFSLTEVNGKSALGLLVTDQGRGIPEESLAPDGPPTSSTGMGLGLRGVQRIATRFDVDTGHEGTRIDATFLPAAGLPASPQLVDQAEGALTELRAKDPTAALSEKNRELTEGIADRDLLMQELHHRTGNNLALIVALIRMSKSQAEQDETQQVLTELEVRVGSLAKAHELMQRGTDAGQVDLAEMLDEVAKNSERAFSGGALTANIEVSCATLQLDSKFAIDIGLIIGELITNAFKYAFVGRDRGLIRVEVTGDPTRGIALLVSDNGVGLPPDAERPERSNSLGWRMIRTLTFQHDANLTVDGADGLRVHIKFPPRS